MEAIRHFQRRYCGGALAAAVILGLGGYLAGWPSITRGLVLGSIFSAINFLLLANTLTRKLIGRHRRTTLLVITVRLSRYLLWAIPVVVAVNLPAVDLPAAIAGLFMVPICIMMDTLFNLVRGAKPPLN